METSVFVHKTRNWLEKFVIGLNLCPFAKKPFESGKVRYVLSSARRLEDLLMDLGKELEFLHSTNPSDCETTLVIHPYILQDFADYNDFIEVVDALIIEMGLEGEYQAASFHPDYQFAGTQPDDPENYTNRSPYPMFHLLRESSLEEAIAHHPDTDQIPQRNIRLMNELGTEKILAILKPK